MTEITLTPIGGTDLSLSWESDCRYEWAAFLRLLKSNVPQKSRKWNAPTKSWIIQESYSAVVRKFPDIVAAESAKPTEELRSAYFNESIASLPDSMKSRAEYAVNALMGKSSVEPEYCLSNKQFGVFHEVSGCWLYTDGTYSTKSPSERDDELKRSEAAELFRTISFLDQNGELYQAIDAKNILRKKMLDHCGRKCIVCAVAPDNPSKLHMHRVIPGKDGGLYVEENIAMLCAKCHRTHEGKTWEDIRSLAI